MGYSIIFETKIVTLSDGRVIHFDRSGCNNDDAGRRKNEFSAKILTKEEFVAKAEGFKKNSKPYKESDGWDLKIGSRCATFYDYGEHLLRMLRRAKPYPQFIYDKYFKVEHCTGVELMTPEHKTITVKEFNKTFYDLLHNSGGLSYRYLIEYPSVADENNIVRLIENDESVSFEIRAW